MLKEGKENTECERKRKQGSVGKEISAGTKGKKGKRGERELMLISEGKGKGC